MTSAFIPEYEIYGLLSRVGIKTPRYYFVDDDSKVADAPFASGDPRQKGESWMSERTVGQWPDFDAVVAQYNDTLKLLKPSAIKSGIAKGKAVAVWFITAKQDTLLSVDGWDKTWSDKVLGVAGMAVGAGA